MTATLDVTVGKKLVIRDEQDMLDDLQLSALRAMGLENVPPAMQAVFVHVCKRTKLDPFTRQIYLIERFGQGGPSHTIQTGIDGYRVIRDRVVEERGLGPVSYEDTEWCDANGKWSPVWLDDTKQPVAARVAIIVAGARYPAVAHWREYAATKSNGDLTKMWKTRGAGQLAKCSEALALRKGFPNDLAGLYIEEEMDKANVQAQEEAQVAALRKTHRPAQPKPREEQVDEQTGEIVDAELVDDDQVAEQPPAVEEPAAPSKFDELMAREDNTKGVTLTLDRIAKVAEKLELDYDAVDAIALEKTGLRLADLGAGELGTLYNDLHRSAR